MDVNIIKYSLKENYFMLILIKIHIFNCILLLLLPIAKSLYPFEMHKFFLRKAVCR